MIQFICLFLAFFFLQISNQGRCWNCEDIKTQAQCEVFRQDGKKCYWSNTCLTKKFTNSCSESNTSELCSINIHECTWHQKLKLCYKDGFATCDKFKSSCTPKNCYRNNKDCVSFPWTNRCVNLETKEQCDKGSLICSYNETSKPKCQQFNFKGQCSSFYNEYDCKRSSRSCNWDPKKQTCSQTFKTPGCDISLTEQDCLRRQNANCEWYGGQCLDDVTSAKCKIHNKTICDKAIYCRWVQEKNICELDYCQQFKTNATCTYHIIDDQNAQPCFWDPVHKCQQSKVEKLPQDKCYTANQTATYFYWNGDTCKNCANNLADIDQVNVGITDILGSNGLIIYYLFIILLV